MQFGKADRVNQLIFDIAAEFIDPKLIIKISPLGNGNINDTYLVSTCSEQRQDFVLQKLNSNVFSNPKAVVMNMELLLNHIQSKLGSGNDKLNNLTWQIPSLRKASNSNNNWHLVAGSFWRATSFIDQAYSTDVIDNYQKAEEIGTGLGIFHWLMEGISIDKLNETIKDFHVTSVYYDKFILTLNSVDMIQSEDAKWCIDFIKSRRGLVSILENAICSGELYLRPIHGDPKINNFMFDKNSHKTIAMVDLDTLMAGLIHYDIGDCVRSGCNPAGEEEKDLNNVFFDFDKCKAILSGYLNKMGSSLTEYDFKYLYAAIRLIPFELGIRFFTDYLAGNKYFKVDSLEHNLDRAMVQFKLTESIEEQEYMIKQCIEDLK
jgi:hypothetical protein